MSTGSKRLIRAGILGGLAYSAWRAWRRRVPAPTRDDISWDNAPFPFPPIPRPSIPRPPVALASVVATSPPAAEAAIEPFSDPGADGSCPATHPVKAKLASGIYHLPGSGNYERTKPDRCYVDGAAAEADGLRAAKR